MLWLDTGAACIVITTNLFSSSAHRSILLGPGRPGHQPYACSVINVCRRRRRPPAPSSGSRTVQQDMDSKATNRQTQQPSPRALITMSASWNACANGTHSSLVSGGRRRPAAVQPRTASFTTQPHPGPCLLRPGPSLQSRERPRGTGTACRGVG